MSAHDHPTVQLIDKLLDQLRVCHGDLLSLTKDDVLKDRANDARTNIRYAIEELRQARIDKEQRLRGPE